MGVGRQDDLSLRAAAAVGLCSLFVILYAIRSKTGPKISGADGLLGVTATVIEPIGPGDTPGRVRVLGEDWSARLIFKAAASNARLERETPVRVKKALAMTTRHAPEPPQIGAVHPDVVRGPR